MSAPLASARIYLQPRMLALLVLGFASGLPAPLVFSNLSMWLKTEGISRTDIGLFALASTPYAISFLWAPLVDQLRLPLLGRWLGQRRSWMLLTQLLMVATLLFMARFSPAGHIQALALAAVMVSFVSATYDIVLDAFRIESLKPNQYGAGSAIAIWGWHLGGTMVGGAGGLYLAHYYGWNLSYQVLALSLLLGIVAVLLSPEPERTAPPPAPPSASRWQTVTGWLRHTLVEPFRDFTQRDGWLLILSFVFLFKFGDAMLGRMSNVFYLELGFELVDIANISKIYGFLANLIGVFLGGLVAQRLGYLKALMLCGLLAALTNLTYSALAVIGPQNWALAVAVISDNLTMGLVTVAFVAYLSSLCNVAYTATQYSLLSSLGNLSRIWLASSSGYVVDQLGGNWSLFFMLTAALALVGLPLLWLIMRRFPDHAAQRSP
ncbi:AmpG family muropeptide MFS transporter [Isoalcanivorax beigongshangi]|uniref:MFS transporter n=1 Tax=Isoalcanivorax beigongshangi TaxID=3238810 RepID=A0ABV4AJ33_9GAMM